MCRGAGFHADKARRQGLEELYQLAAAELLSDDDLLGRVDAVNLEYVLGEIQTDRGNLHVDGSPHVIRLRRTTLWHSMPGAGVVHHIKSRHFNGNSIATTVKTPQLNRPQSSSCSPTVFPVFKLTRCTPLHAKQVTVS
jgi:hypothetical protein